MVSTDNIWDNELNSLLQNHESQVPEGLWDELSESLDELNHELEFDDSLRNSVNEAQINPPADVWNAVQTGLGKASIFSGSVGLITKVVVTSLLVAGGLTAWYFSSEKDNREEIAGSETVEHKVPQQEKQNAYETSSEEPLSAINPDEHHTEDSRDRFAEIKSENKSSEAIQNTGLLSESSPQSEITGSSESGTNPSESNKKGESQSSSNANDIPAGKNENPPVGKQAEALFKISIEKKELCPGEKFKAYLDNPGNRKAYAVLDGSRFLISGKENILDLKAPAMTGDYILRCFDGMNNAIPGAFVKIHVSSFEAEAFTVTEKGDAAFELKHGNEGSTISTWKIDHIESGTGNVINIRFSDKEISEHRVVLVQKNEAGCVDSVVGKIINKTTIAEPVIPDVFTPGGDGFNDEFIVKIEGEEQFLLMIYDDIGTLLFKSEDKNKGWDGINPHTGAKCRGKHFAILRYKLIGMPQKEIIGSFTIIQP